MPRDCLVGDIFEVRWVGECFQQKINLVHHYRTRLVSGGLPWTTVVDHMKASLTVLAGGAGNVETPYRACLPAQWLAQRIDFQLIYPIRLAKISFVLAGSGTHAHDTESSNQASVITFRGEEARRKMVANYHVGPIPQDVTVQDEGYLTTAYKTLLNDLADGMNQTVVDVPDELTMDPIIFHRNPINAINSYDNFFSWVVQPTIRTMRSRTVGKGE